MRINSLGFFVLRSPLLPYHTIQNLGKGQLKTLYQQPVLQEALYLASPQFYKIILNWLKGKDIEKSQLDRIQLTLTKYLLRMSFRSTPFGLFAGVSTGRIQDLAQATLKSRNHYHTNSRLDMDYLCARSGSYHQQERVRENLLYYPNNTLYQIGNQFRYAEYRITQEGTQFIRKHFLSSIDYSEVVHNLLARAKEGLNRNALIAILMEELNGQYEVTPERAAAYIQDLVDNQILQSELEPVITGKNYLSHIQTLFEKYLPEDLENNRLIEIANDLVLIDRQELGKGMEAYNRLEKKLSLNEIPFEENKLFQTDLQKPIEVLTLPSRVVDELSKTIQLLAQLPTQLTADRENFDQFKKAFFERYETREVSLLEVMDVEVGLGYPISSMEADMNPLLDDLVFTGATPGEIPSLFTTWHGWLLNKYAEAVQKLHSGSSSPAIQLDENEIKDFLVKEKNLPASLFSLISILSPSSDHINRGEYRIWYRTTSGPSAANLLGRFCCGNPELSELVQKALREEEAKNPHAVFAEIVHINQARIGNIAIRPLLRDYEIPIVTQPGVSPERTILLEDLTIAYRDHQLILRSKRLGKEIIPRLSTAHHYSSDTLPTYHFLCDFQFQEVDAKLYWDWGPLAQAKWLPRVTHEKCILTPARWLISKEDFNRDDQRGFLQQVRELRHEKKIPQHVTVRDGDNILPLDLENDLSNQLLESLLPSPIWLEENLWQNSAGWVEGPEGAFTNEVILPLTATNPSPKAIPANGSLGVSSLVRTFPVGSEWLYLKIYCGVKTADKIIREVIKPLSESFVDERVIDQWFYIRYADPKSHLRVRFHGNAAMGAAPAFYARILEELHQALAFYFETGLVSNFTVDTYLREVERYGGQNILPSEWLFFIDSETAAQIIDLLEGEEADNLRWLIALRNMDAWLDDFQMDLKTKIDCLHRWQAHLKQTLRANSLAINKSLASKFRKERSRIDYFLKPSHEVEEPYQSIFKLMESRSVKWQRTITGIVETARRKELAVDLEDLLVTYIHMSTNRLLRSNQLQHEMVLYDFLHLHYQSLHKRNSQPAT